MINTNFSEIQSTILNRDARKQNTTIVLARTDKTKANYYNVYFLDESKNEFICIFYEQLIKKELLNDVHELVYFLLGYYCTYVKIENLSNW